MTPGVLRSSLPVHAYETLIFDVDGTLIDSNAAHAKAWLRALREHGEKTDFMTVRQLVGVGADKLLPAVAGLEEDSDRGRAIAERKAELFAEMLPCLRSTHGARTLLAYLLAQRRTVAIATSASTDELDALLRQARLDDLARIRASKDDAGGSKPDPDVVCAALAKAGAARETAVMIGDTPYDIEAAARAGVASIALRCGGHWTDRDLRRAQWIFEDPQELLQQWRASGGWPRRLALRASG